jgi:uncharacterized protein
MLGPANAVGCSAVVFYNTMAQYLWRISERFLRPAAILWVCVAGLCFGEAAFSLTRAEMYQATAPVSDRSEAAQTTAFQNAMRTVLIRVTGRRSADDDPNLSQLVSNARRYVQQYRAAPDSQLWVAFDGPAIERWLTQNGQPLWGHERPTTLVLLSVQSGAQGGVITTDDTSELKAAIDAAASARGLPLVWPSAAELQKFHIDYAAVSSGSASAFADIGKRFGSDGILVGRANGATVNANVRWTHLFQDRSSEYSGTQEGVNRAADLYASLFAASGSLAPVDIEVTGVNDLRDYAGLQSYLESLTFISHVSVESLTGDTVRFRLATRGGDSLQRALSLNGRLQPVAAGENGIQRFQLHH